MKPTAVVRNNASAMEVAEEDGRRAVDSGMQSLALSRDACVRHVSKIWGDVDLHPWLPREGIAAKASCLNFDTEVRLVSLYSMIGGLGGLGVSYSGAPLIIPKFLARIIE